MADAGQPTADHAANEVSDGNADLLLPGGGPEHEAEEMAAERAASEVAATSSTLLLHTLPHELLLRILAFLDVPDLLAVSRVSRPMDFARLVFPSLSSVQRGGGDSFCCTCQVRARD